MIIFTQQDHLFSKNLPCGRQRRPHSPSDIVHYLQSKIGYHDDASGKNYGMCVSVLNKCQDYSYESKNNKKTYVINNQVIQQYLQRTLVQIKSAQDAILSDYAEDCVQDVLSCLSQNNYAENRTTVAINACRPLIKTCMSVNGYTQVGDAMEKAWVQSINADDNTVSVLEKMANCKDSKGEWNQADAVCDCTKAGTDLQQNKDGKCVTKDQKACEDSDGAWSIKGECECKFGTVKADGSCMSEDEYKCTNNSTNSYFWHAGKWDATNNKCNCADSGKYRYASDPDTAIEAFELKDGSCVLIPSLQSLKETCENIEGATWAADTNPICKCPSGYKTKTYVIDSSDYSGPQYSLYNTSAICVPEDVYKCENGGYTTNPIENWASGYWDRTTNACKCITTDTIRSVVDNVCIKNN